MVDCKFRIKVLIIWRIHNIFFLCGFAVVSIVFQDVEVKKQVVEQDKYEDSI